MTSSWTHPGWSGKKDRVKIRKRRWHLVKCTMYVSVCKCVQKHQKIYGFALTLFRQGGIIIRQWGGNYQAHLPPFTPKPTPTQEAIAVDRMPMFGVY